MTKLKQPYVKFEYIEGNKNYKYRLNICGHNLVAFKNIDEALEKLYEYKYNWGKEYNIYMNPKYRAQYLNKELDYLNDQIAQLEISMANGRIDGLDVTGLLARIIYYQDAYAKLINTANEKVK